MTPDAIPVPAPSAAPAPAARHKHVLLVVDDEPDVCNSVQHLLRRRYEVLKAHSAAEAAEVLAAHEVEIILTDQRMPGVSGVEMLQNVKIRFPEAVRMLYTGYSDLDSVVAAVNKGHIYRFLNKPWQPEELEAAVDDAAAEYHRLVGTFEELEVSRRRIAELEDQVQTLRSKLDDPSESD